MDLEMDEDEADRDEVMGQLDHQRRHVARRLAAVVDEMEVSTRDRKAFLKDLSNTTNNQCFR